MIERLLIANRGEIARRIMRTCRQLGVVSVAVFSDADADAAFVQDADLAVGIGGNTPAESYLRVDAILDAAQRAGADAIHPGYGFLAENAEFAQAVLDAGLTFVGPTPDAIAAMGSKLEAKRRMADAGVPLLPSVELTGLDGAVALRAASEVGYPLLIKASAGGGGRGMRIVTDASELEIAVSGAVREAESAFGDGTIYAERYVSPSRHVEVQIFGDATGQVVHFHERECSIQRRHQKIIEEAPSPSLDDATRTALHEAAVAAGKAIGYTNAGTVEFLLAPTGEFFFLEVNTRLQVEHPVTEEVLGVDLVELQLAVAAGGVVPEQSAIGPVRGHAVEVRLYAEDPMQSFLPSTGTLSAFEIPGDLRVESAIEGAGEVTQYYDPMIAKVIAHAPTRPAACRKLAASLSAATIHGIRTNRELLVRTLRHAEFLGDQGDSEFLTRNDPAELGRPLVEGNDRSLTAIVAALALQSENRRRDSHTPAASSGFRNVATVPQQVRLGSGDDEITVAYRFRHGRLVHLAVDDEVFDDATVYSVTADRVDLAVAGVRRQFDVSVADERVVVQSMAGTAVFEPRPRFTEPGVVVEAGSTVATMPGMIVALPVTVGDVIAVGDVLVVMEAMKMELSIAASSAGTVSAIEVVVGDSVDAGTVLVVISGEDE